MILEAFMDTAVFGPRRWMVRTTDGTAIAYLSDAQFSTREDAESAIHVAGLLQVQAEQQLGQRVRDAVEKVLP